MFETDKEVDITDNEYLHEVEDDSRPSENYWLRLKTEIIEEWNKEKYNPKEDIVEASPKQEYTPREIEEPSFSSSLWTKTYFQPHKFWLERPKLKKRHAPKTIGK
jgi:hypothetical protein